MHRANQAPYELPKSHWLLPWEREEIIAYAKKHPDEGYRRLIYMMIDENIVAVSPSSVYRVLLPLGLLCDYEAKKSKKGSGFIQPTCPNEHWHTDISYINIACTFYYYISVLDGYSRLIIHWELRPSMTEMDVELVILKAHEKYPDAKPRIISDNGPQYIANDFKLFIRQQSMTHVKTSPYYPQSNGKLERFHKTLKTECVRKDYLQNIDHATALLESYIDYYNTKRLHSAIGYVAPMDRFTGKDKTIIDERRKKLKQAKQTRRSCHEKSDEKS